MNWLWNNSRVPARRQGAFSLVELMIAICILAVGIVGVLRSFLSASAVLDHLNNRVSALVILDGKIGALGESGVGEAASGEEAEVLVGVRKAVFRQKACAFRKEGAESPFNQVSMSVIWNEGAMARDESIDFIVDEKS